MHVLCRKDPDPRTSELYSLPGSSPGSECATDYRFGLLDSELEEYTKLADLHHGLVLLRYGSSRLNPYLMTRVDIIPVLLKELPFHSLFRGCTEGGEHCHYLHQCIYYAHSSRGGGWRKEEPILALFKWSYRRMREKIEQGEHAGEFLKFVRSCFAEVGRDYTEEFGEQSEPSEVINQHSAVTDGEPAVTSVSCEWPVTSVINEQHHVSQATNEQPDVSALTDKQSAGSEVTYEHTVTNGHLNISAMTDCQPEYRRGKTVYFSSHQFEEVQKGMVIDLTPKKKHVRIATSSKQRPINVALDCLKEPPMQPLKDLKFVISGNIAERGEKEKVNTEKLTEIIKSLGGTVFTGDVEKAADASLIIVTSQKEIDKPTQKLTKTLIMAYRLGWKIISKKLILEARNTNMLPPISDFELDLSSIRTAPASNVVHAKLFTTSAMINNQHVVGGHRELKKKLRGDSLKRKTLDNARKENRPPKKPCTAYAMFSKNVWKSVVKEHPDFSMLEINSFVSEMWKEVGDEERRVYQQKALENYARRTECLNSDNRQP